MDSYDGDPIVQTAVSALRAFGGDLSRDRAETLLGMWTLSRALTGRERAAVRDRFGAAPIQAPGNSGAGF